jgi:hypothetical protein
MKEVDEKGNVIQEKVIYDNAEIEGFVCDFSDESVAALLAEDAPVFWEEEGRKYEVMPVEEFKVKEMEVNFNYFTLNEKGKYERVEVKGMKILIYAGDSNIVHNKNEVPRLISLMRGKQITDDNRMTFIAKNSEDAKVLVDYIYHICGLNVNKIDHPGEKRFIAKAGQNVKRNDVSKAFKDKQPFAASFLIPLPEVGSGGGVMKKELANLEFQFFITIDNILRDGVSSHSKSSHKRYRTKRVWDLMWQMIFPPSVYGEEYWRLMMMGYDYGYQAQFFPEIES